MTQSKYVLVGAGMTAHAAARGIRSVDPSGGIVMVGDEAAAPYARPPLSKALWSGQPEGSIWLPPVEGVEHRAGVRVVAIDRASRRVALEGGDTIGYERLLLATGGAPRRLSGGADGIVYFRTIADHRRVRALPAGKHVAIVGGGFIGSEMAAALTGAGYRVTLLFPEGGIGFRLFPRDLSLHLNRTYAERGVDVRPGQPVTGILADGDGFTVLTPNGALRADLVIAGLGTIPNTDLAAAAGLSVDDGILVNDRLRTSDPSIFAAGDVARFPSALLGERVRVEHEDNANRMGWDAGRAMAGADVIYRHQPFFYSDLFDLGYEAIGTLDSRLSTVADWTEPYRKGIVYYLAEGRVRGVLAWGVFGKMDEARALLGEPGPHAADALRGRIAA
jgi:NADPH-dependent 2,4-dienoyl-CoA reductase/sulfur reductase-like enzyme